MILELPDEFEPLVSRLIDAKQAVDVEFVIDKQEFFFSTLVKDTAYFFESIPVMILAWPNEMRLKPRRRAIRTKTILPEELVDRAYIRDISVFGLGLIWIQEPLLEIGDQLELDLQIPTLNPKNPVEILIHQVRVRIEVKRQTQYKGLPLYGCEYIPFKSSIFFLIRQYCAIRKKEDAFYIKNQYYPKQVLPEVKVVSTRKLVSASEPE